MRPTMLELEIRSMASSDVEDLNKWVPPSSEDIFFGLALEIGVLGEAGADLFQIEIATPEALKKRGRDPQQSTPRLLTVNGYDWPTIEQRVRDVVQSCASETWPASVDALRRRFYWEYEGYQSGPDC